MGLDGCLRIICDKVLSSPTTQKQEKGYATAIIASLIKGRLTMNSVAVSSTSTG